MVQEVTIAPHSSSFITLNLELILLIVLLIIPIVLLIVFFKKKKYFIFKGGIIGLIISLIYIPLSFWDPGCPIDNCFFLKKFFLGITHLVYSECEFLTRCGGERCMGCALVFAPMLAFLQFILIGFLIGWIIEKIKSPTDISNK